MDLLKNEHRTAGRVPPGKCLPHRYIFWPFRQCCGNRTSPCCWPVRWSRDENHRTQKAVSLPCSPSGPESPLLLCIDPVVLNVIPASFFLSNYLVTFIDIWHSVMYILPQL